MSMLTHLVPHSGFPKTTMLAWLAVMMLGPMPGAPALADDNESLARSETIVLGRVSNNSRKHYAALDALGRYLVKHADRIQRHKTLLASDNEEMIELLRTGKVDLVSESAASAILYEQAADASIFLRQWKGGNASYRTFFFTHKDSEIQTIEDLAGRLIAFEDSGSTSGFFVPKATIEAHELSIKNVDEPRRTGDVGYLFADSEVNVVGWVARKKVDAGVISDVHWDDDSRAPLGLRNQLRIFHETPEIIRSVMVAGPALDEEQRRQVSNILLGMHETAEGLDVLKQFYKTTRFDRLIGDAGASLDHIRSLFDPAAPAPPS